MKINADGTVTIYGSKGTIKTVKPEDLPAYKISYQDYLSAKTAYDQINNPNSVINPAEQAKIEAQSVQSGYTTPDKVGVAAQKILQESKYVAPLTGDALKAQQQKEAAASLSKSAISSIDRVLSKDTNPLTGTLQLGVSKFNPLATEAKGTLAEYEKLKSLLSLENIKYLRGTGQISDREGMILEKAALAIPQDRKIPDEEFRAILQRTRKELETGIGTSVKQETLPMLPKESGVGGAVKSVYDFLMGGATATVRDIVAGATMKGKAGDELYNAFDTNMEIANNAMEMMKNEKNPEVRKKYETIANNALNEITDNSSKVVNLFSDKINDPLWLRSFETGADIAGTASLVNSALKLPGYISKKLAQKAAEKASAETVKQTAKQTTKSLTKKPSLIKQILSPRQTVYQKEMDAAKNVLTEVNNKEIATNTKNLLKLNQGGSAAYEKVVAPDLEKVKTVPDLVKVLGQWGNKGYLKAGGVKGTFAADAYDAAYKAGIEHLKTIAPEVYKYRRVIFHMSQIPKYAKKVAIITALLGLSKSAFGKSMQQNVTNVTNLTTP